MLWVFCCFNLSSKYTCFELFVYATQVLVLLYIDLLKHVFYNRLNTNIWSDLQYAVKYGKLYLDKQY